MRGIITLFLISGISSIYGQTFTEEERAIMAVNKEFGWEQTYHVELVEERMQPKDYRIDPRTLEINEYYYSTPTIRNKYTNNKKSLLTRRDGNYLIEIGVHSKVEKVEIEKQ